jgi:hypothetical protein
VRSVTRPPSAVLGDDWECRQPASVTPERVRSPVRDHRLETTSTGGVPAYSCAMNETDVTRGDRVLRVRDAGDPQGRVVMYFHGTPGSRLDLSFGEQDRKSVV